MKVVRAYVTDSIHKKLTSLPSGEISQFIREAIEEKFEKNKKSDKKLNAIMT